MFDSHAHYDDEKFNFDREELLDRLFAEGLTGFLNSASDERSSEAALEIVHNRSGAFCSAGVHPHEASNVTPGWERRIESLLNEDKCVALGEIGLDYHYDFSPREVQKEVFRTQMAIAAEKDIPVIIHDREAHADVLEIIREFPSVRGVMHSFSGSAETAEILVSLGWYISFSGSLTFKNAQKTVLAAAAVPIDRLLTETDAPYLAPVPCRGVRNDSGLMKHTVQRLAEIRGKNFEEIASAAANNAYRLFRIAK